MMSLLSCGGDVTFWLVLAVGDDAGSEGCLGDVEETRS
jgi:hypothetical protein